PRDRRPGAKRHFPAPAAPNGAHDCPEQQELRGSNGNERERDGSRQRQENRTFEPARHTSHEPPAIIHADRGSILARRREGSPSAAEIRPNSGSRDSPRFRSILTP